MPDYGKFATKAIDTAHNRGIDVADPDAVESIAKEVAKEYVVDEEKLVAIVRQRAKEYTDAGNIYENPPEKSDDYPEADVIAEYLFAKASEYDVPDEEIEDIDWSKYNTDEHLKDHDITAPDRESRWLVQYESSFKQSAVSEIECTESVAIDNELDFFNSLCVDGDETTVKSLAKEDFIIGVKQYDED